jgi:hypothetical protein
MLSGKLINELIFTNIPQVLALSGAVNAIQAESLAPSCSECPQQQLVQG